MKQNITTIQSLELVWRHLSRKRRLQFTLLAAAMVVMSALEIVTLGAVLPFLGALTVPEKVFEYTILQPLWHMLGISDAVDLILPVTLLFCVAALLAGVWRLLILFASTRFAYAVGADFGYQIFSQHLQLPYVEHMRVNSGDLLSVITMKVNHVVNAVIFQSLAMMVSLVICLTIASALMLISAEITLTALGLFGVIYSAVFFFERRKLIAQSIIIANNSVSIINTINEALGSIKDVILYGMAGHHKQRFRSYDLPMRRAQAYHQFVGQAPRYAIESMGMVIIAVIAYQQVVSNNGGMDMLAVLGTFALGAQRLLPAAQQVFSAITSINGGKASLDDVLGFLGSSKTLERSRPSAPLVFEDHVAFSQIKLNFAERESPVLNDITLSIKKGECIGIIGETGSGKSSLLSLFMGLLEPSQGNITVDGVKITGDDVVRWQNNICHVPQSVFLMDGTIQHNITLSMGRNNIDHHRLEAAVAAAQLQKTVNRLGSGLASTVGERGSRISGGEIQRIGIARALYQDRNVLVLDEATSSLDNDVEQEVIAAIHAQKSEKTIIMVAHRMSSLKCCDRLLQVKNGTVTIIEGSSSTFRSLVGG
jgi:ATP-binding cassette subfamily B protein